MDENWLGYALNLHDDETQRHLDAEAGMPDARQRLERVRQALAPLAIDRADPEPPRDLAARTLSRLAEFRRRPSRRPNWAEPAATAGPARWRRADALVAACLLVLFGGLSLSGLTRLQHRQQIEACQNNLRQFHQALIGYSEEHQGRFPQITDEPPLNQAGSFIAMLQNDGLLSPTVRTTCPSAVTVPVVRPAMPADARPSLTGSYAYSLGYRDADGRLYGLRMNGPETDLMPIMSDRPAPLRNPGQSSPNHGTGQNVLSIGGQVRFCTNSRVGVAGDDIFLNDDSEVAAGLHRLDTVLGATHDRP